MYSHFPTRASTWPRNSFRDRQASSTASALPRSAVSCRVGSLIIKSTPISRKNTRQSVSYRYYSIPLGMPTTALFSISIASRSTASQIFGPQNSVPAQFHAALCFAQNRKKCHTEHYTQVRQNNLGTKKAKCHIFKHKVDFVRFTFRNRPASFHTKKQEGQTLLLSFTS